MAGSGEGDLTARVLAALPGTMRQIVERAGWPDHTQVWDEVSRLRKVGAIKRSPGADGVRVFSSVAADIGLAPAQKEAAKPQKTQQVVLVSMRGWPEVQPGRPMVFDVRKSAPKAHKAVQRLRERFQEPKLQWWYEPLTKERIRDLQERVNSKTLRDVMSRMTGQES